MFVIPDLIRNPFWSDSFLKARLIFGRAFCYNKKVCYCLLYFLARYVSVGRSN